MILATCAVYLIVDLRLAGAARPTAMSFEQSSGNSISPDAPVNQAHAVAGAEGNLHTRKPVMWLHVHKSGGTTICHEAQKHGENIVQPAYFCGSDKFGDWLPSGNFHFVSNQKGTCAERRLMFDPHPLGYNYTFTFAMIERQLDSGDICFDDFVYGTLLRETISRITSEVNFQQPFHLESILSCVDDAIVSPGRHSDCPVPEPLGPNLSPNHSFVYVDNYVIRLLGGSATMLLPPGAVKASHLTAAIETLEKFDLVIPLEELNSERARAAFDRVIGWHPDDGDTARADEDPHNVTLTEHEVKRLRRINKFDIALYEHFLNRFRSSDIT